MENSENNKYDENAKKDDSSSGKELEANFNEPLCEKNIGTEKDIEDTKNTINEIENIDIDNLKSNELKSFSYEKILIVVKNLEKVFLKDFSLVDTNEKLDPYYSHAMDIREMIDMNRFSQELSTPEKKERMMSRIENILFNFSVLINIGNFSAEQSENLKKTQSMLFEQVDAEKESIANDLKKIHEGIKTNISNEFKKQKKETTDSLLKDFGKHKEDVKKEVSELEHATLSHVLSLMGIFSAVIVIIMSVILTATSWLNSADEASALVAFVVPNLVALLSVTMLMSLVYLYIHKNEDEMKKGKVLACIIVVAIVAITLVLSILLMLNIEKVKEENVPHQQFVISLSEYTIIEKEMPENESQKFFVFELDGIRYEFGYDEKYIHYDKIYFCKEHNRLE